MDGLVDDDPCVELVRELRRLPQKPLERAFGLRVEERHRIGMSQRTRERGGLEGVRAAREEIETGLKNGEHLVAVGSDPGAVDREEAVPPVAFVEIESRQAIAKVVDDVNRGAVGHHTAPEKQAGEVPQVPQPVCAHDEMRLDHITLADTHARGQGCLDAPALDDHVSDAGIGFESRHP